MECISKQLVYMSWTVSVFLNTKPVSCNRATAAWCTKSRCTSNQCRNLLQQTSRWREFCYFTSPSMSLPGRITAGEMYAMTMMSLLLLLHGQIFIYCRKCKEESASFHSTRSLHLDFSYSTLPRHLIRCTELHRIHAGCNKSHLIIFSCCWHFCQSSVDSILLCLWRLLTAVGDTSRRLVLKRNPMWSH